MEKNNGRVGVLFMILQTRKQFLNCTFCGKREKKVSLRDKEQIMNGKT